MKKIVLFLLFTCFFSNSYSQSIMSQAYSTDGEVNSVIISGDKLILGGQFSSVGIRTGGSAVFPLGTDQPDLAFPRLIGEIYTSTSDGGNGFFIYGNYYKENESLSQKHSRIEHILANYSFDDNFSFTVSSWDGIKKLVYNNGVLYGCGNFLEIGGVATQGLFGIDVASHTLVNWIPEIISSNGIQTFGVSGNTIYFSGNITSVGALTRTNNAAIEIVTGIVKPWQPNINASFNAIDFFQDKAVLGGAFSQGVNHALATVDLNTGSNVNYFLTENTLYWAASVGKICVEGNIVYAYSTGTYDTRVSAIDLTNGSILWKKYFNMIASADSMLVANGNLYVAGHYLDETFITGLDNAPGNFESKIGNLFSLNAQNGTLNNWHADVVGNGRTAQCLALSGGKLLAGGTFSHVNGFLRTNLCMLNLQGTQVLPYKLNFDGGQVNALKAIDNTLFVGGAISRLDGVLYDRPVMAFNIDTPTMISWQPALTGNAYAFELNGDNLYVGGDLNEVGGAERKNLFAVNKQNAALQSWSPNPDYPVKSLYITDGKLYTGGDFGTIALQERRKIAAFTISDMQITPWNPNVGGTVNAIASNGNTIWIGGDFWGIGTTNVRLFAGVDAVTAAVTDIPTNEPTGAVKAIISQGKWVIAGGGISFGTSIPCDDLMMYDTLSHALVPNSGFCVNIERDFYSGVRSMALLGDNLYFAGKFLKINGSSAASNISGISFPTGFFSGDGNAISYYPHSGGNGGSVTMNFFATTIASGMHLKFTRTGVADIIISDGMISFPESSSMTAVVNLVGVETGQYNIVITNPAGIETVFENGFTVEGSTEPVITAQIIAPSLIRTGTPTKFIIQVHNSSNNDAYGVPVFVFVSGNNTVSFEGPIRDFEGNQLTTLLEADMGENYRGNIGATKAYLPMIPKIPAGGSTSLTVLLQANDNNGNHSIEAVSNEAILSNDISNYTNKSGPLDPYVGCYNEAVKIVRDQVLDEITNGGFGALGSAVECGNGVANIYNNWSQIHNSSSIDTSLQIVHTALACASLVAGAAAIAYPPARAAFGAINAFAALAGAMEGCQKGFNPNKEGNKHESQSRSSLDPNEKFGTGVKDGHYITGELKLPYGIHFENVATAGLPAQKVRIEDTIDTSKFDLSTFSLDYVNIAGHQLTGNSARGLQTAYINLMPEKNMIVKIEMSLDTTSGLFRADFSSLDPLTMHPITDPLEGFLNPNVTAPEGEGSIYFSVLPKQDLVNGTMISNTARISFDVNLPINTAAWNNIVDKVAPVSNMIALPQFSNTLKFNIGWNGTDSESGIEKYDVYYSENDGDYQPYVENYYGNAIEFKAKPNAHYSFYTISTDAVGHRELKSDIAEASIQIVSDDMIVYPNPVSSNLFIEFSPGIVPQEINFIDIQGRRINLSFTTNDGETTVPIGTRLATGFYIVEVISTNAKKMYQKIVVR